MSDGWGSDARFLYPTGVVTDSAGYVYVVDRDNGRIRKISPAGQVQVPRSLEYLRLAIDENPADDSLRLEYLRDWRRSRGRRSSPIRSASRSMEREISTLQSRAVEPFTK